MKISIPNAPKKALEILNKNGFEAYVVGGCVRDSLLDGEPKDWDITTNALPEDTIKIFKGYRLIETGLKHGTVTVLIDSQPLEITTYRIDGKYSDNRRPDSVEFTSDIKEDLSRRDFTVNAMAYNLDNRLVDYFQGQEDLQNKVIRCVGDADTRFNEDALRILRALRFASVLDFKIEGKTTESIFKNKNLLKNIASERIDVEFNKLICGKNAEKILMDYNEIYTVFMPELEKMFGFYQNNPHHIFDVWEHTVKSMMEVRNTPILRLTMLLHDIGKPVCYTVDDKNIGHFYGHPQKSSKMAENILKRLKYDNYTIETVSKLVYYHDYRTMPNKKAVRKLLNKTGEEIFGLLLEVQRADCYAQNPDKLDEKLARVNAVEGIFENILQENLCYRVKDLMVSGGDLIAVGIPQGKKIGETLNWLLELVIDEKLENSKNDLLEMVTKNLL